jgi:hypothetical protein
MALFWTDNVVICCSNVGLCKKWWMDMFECKEVKVPEDWDDTLPSDVALKLPGDDKPTVLLSARGEVYQAGFSGRGDGHPILFCNKLLKAYDHFRAKGVVAGAIQDGGGTEFFEIRDPEGSVIEICHEP